MKVGIYIRKSRAEDGVQDLQKHEEYLKSICTNNKWQYEIYSEIDSSQNLDRKELQRLIEDVKDKKINAVMVNAADRLSRKSLHFLTIMEEFINSGMTRLFIKDIEHNLLDPTTVTLLQITSSLSQAEYSFIVERMTQGRKQSAKEGVYSGKIVYGYTFDHTTRKLEIVPDEAKIVREIADMLLEGFSYGKICDLLNLSGKRTRKGNSWQVHNIKSIIHSPTIRGHVIVNWQNEKTEKLNNHEAIITEGEYQKIKEILSKRREQYKNLKINPSHFLQGLLVCSNCGRNITVASSKKSYYIDGKRYYDEKNIEYYVRKCRSCGHGQGCNVKEVEKIVEETISQISNQINDKIVQLKKLNQEEITAKSIAKRKDLEKSIQKISNQEESLLDLLVDGIISKEAYQKRIEKLKKDKKKLQEEINKIPSIDVSVEIKRAKDNFDMAKKYKNLPDDDKRRLLQLLFEKIVYSNKGDQPFLGFYAN